MGGVGGDVSAGCVTLLAAPGWPANAGAARFIGPDELHLATRQVSARSDPSVPGLRSPLHPPQLLDRHHPVRRATDGKGDATVYDDLLQEQPNGLAGLQAAGCQDLGGPFLQ